LKPEDKPIAIAAGFIGVILAVGTVYTLSTQGSATLLSPAYLLQQLQVGAFLGIIAAGMMLVILIGHIDLSVPWTLTAAAMIATAVGGPLAVPTGLAVGLAIGLVNGIGVAYLRVPSMIFTLGVNAVMRGLMVAHTGGFAPQTAATGLMRLLGAERIASVPVALLVWGAASVAVSTLLNRTTFGKALYLIGNREAAAYLAGIRTRSSHSRCAALQRPCRASCSLATRPKLIRGWAMPICCPRSQRCCRTHKYLRWSRTLSRDVVRRHTDRSPQFGAIDHADVGSESTDYLWYSHHSNVARLWS